MLPDIVSAIGILLSIPGGVGYCELSIVDQWPGNNFYHRAYLLIILVSEI